jgi:S-adenosylmethionine:tRNA ribosyltransferase-isomerase
LEIKGCELAFVTVHLGMGNFRDIDVEDLTKHKMDSEQAIIPQEAVDIVNKAQAEGRQICAVGTSVVRAMESSITSQNQLKPFDGWTNKFIFPPYDFAVATSLVTNFHLPLSVMLMQASAFGGYDLIKEAYKVALAEGYRFGAYGDAMLII